MIFEGQLMFSYIRHKILNKKNDQTLQEKVILMQRTRYDVQKTNTRSRKKILEFVELTW